ncbi:protein hunchback-like [Sycon ciliatum]|uniref:protein hunchback-like n=1 Tax=Sycon ciliatum TaxID=27933 RepID=UPI0031F6BEC5
MERGMLKRKPIHGWTSKRSSSATATTTCHHHHHHHHRRHHHHHHQHRHQHHTKEAPSSPPGPAPTGLPSVRLPSSGMTSRAPSRCHQPSRGCLVICTSSCPGLHHNQYGQPSDTVTAAGQTSAPLGSFRGPIGWTSTHSGSFKDKFLHSWHHLLVLRSQFVMSLPPATLSSLPTTSPL